MSFDPNYLFYIIPAAVVVDLLIGDPSRIPHPVVLMGKCISFLERHLRAALPKTASGERRAGRLMALILLAGTAAVTIGILALGYRIHPVLGCVLETVMCWQALAIRDLRVESMRVYRELKEPADLPAARKAVSRIVGRDTERLDEDGVTRAAVETVAENFSDGVTAPLFYMAIAGGPLAMIYKAVNTMDSMVGYKNERYLNFGRAGAKLDDFFGWLPSRIGALLWIAASLFTGQSARGAFRIWRRDSSKHASPNSAQTESACAGSLGVQLAGPAWYFGEYVDKQTIGDATRPIEPYDIVRANRVMTTASLLGAAAFLGIRFLILWLAGLI